MMETTLDVTGHMPFLSPDQPWYSTEGLKCHAVLTILFRHAMRRGHTKLARQRGWSPAVPEDFPSDSTRWECTGSARRCRRRSASRCGRSPDHASIQNSAINSKALVRCRQACSGAGTRGAASPHFFDRGNASSTPPLFWTKIRAKGSPLLQLVSYLLKRSVR